MDQNDSLLEIETSNKSNKNYFLFIKKSLQFLVPISLLSLFLTYSTYGFSLFFTYNFHFSTIVSPLFFSHALDRKYMFLICNGILAFIAKSLSLNSSSSPSPTDNFIDHEETIEVVDIVLEDEEKEQQEGKEAEDGGEEGKFKAEYNSLIIERAEDLYIQDEEDEIEEKVALLVEAVGEEGNEVNLNTEELNHKFEEFIRKMKEEIRIEAQQQLLVA